MVNGHFDILAALPPVNSIMGGRFLIGFSRYGKVVSTQAHTYTHTKTLIKVYLDYIVSTELFLSR